MNSVQKLKDFLERRERKKRSLLMKALPSSTPKPPKPHQAPKPPLSPAKTNNPDEPRVKVWDDHTATSLPGDPTKLLGPKPLVKPLKPMAPLNYLPSLKLKPNLMPK